MMWHGGPPIRPALVSPGWPPGSVPNGIVSYVGRICEGLRACGIAPIVISTQQIRDEHRGPDVFDGSGPTLTWSARAWQILGQPYRGLEASLDRAMQRVAKLAETQGANLIECEESFGLPALLRRHTKLPIVTRLHGPWLIHQALKQRPTAPAFDRRRVESEEVGLRCSDGITAPSMDVALRMKPTTDALGAEVVVIPNPIRVPSDLATRPLPAVTSDRILFVGRFDAHKGGDLMIDALALLRRRGHDLRLVFCGPDRGVANGGEPRVSLAEYASRSLGSERAALELRGQQPHAVIDGLRQLRPITCVPSRYENFPYSCLEAMASASPVVAARTAGLAEIITDGVDGLLHEPGNVESLADCVERLVGDPSLADRLGRAAMKTVRERYDVEHVARRTLEFYSEVIRRIGTQPGRRSR